jgi:malate dehydrogenase
MRDIAIDIAVIGAGELGGAVAHSLARRNVARAIRLIDDTRRVAEGKALDILQAAPVEGFTSHLSGSTDWSTAGGAAVIVIADRVEGPEWRGEDGLSLLQRLTALAPRAVIVSASASPLELIEDGVRKLRLDSRRLLGSAPEALAGAARAMVALAVDGSPRDVALSILGVPPSRIVLPWEDATVAGFATTRLIDEPTRRRLTNQLAALWPPGPYALAAAATKTVEAIVGRARTLVTVFVGPDDSAGQRARTAALPVRLGAAGIERVVLPKLNVADRVALENAMLL